MTDADRSLAQPRLGSSVPQAMFAGAPQDPLDRAMDRYAEGDDRAFAELFSGLSPRIRAFLRRLSGSPELADDLTQETFMKLHQARGSFARGRSVVPWVYAIARNCYMSHARSPRARLSRESVDLGKLEISSGRASCPEDATIAMQSAAAVERALRSMTPARREAFVLLRYEGLSVGEAAQILGVSEGALKLRAFHAYEAIRAALKELEGETPAS